MLLSIKFGAVKESQPIAGFTKTFNNLLSLPFDMIFKTFKLFLFVGVS